MRSARKSDEVLTARARDPTLWETAASVMWYPLLEAIDGGVSGRGSGGTPAAADAFDYQFSPFSDVRSASRSSRFSADVPLPESEL